MAVVAWFVLPSDKMSQEFINLDSASPETKCMCLEPDERFHITYSDYDHEGRDVILCERCGCENREITVCDDDEESPAADTELTNQSSYTVINNAEEASKQIREGDHVAWKREKDIVLTTVEYNHHAIVESIDDQEMRVIEYKELPHAKKLTIQQTTYSLSCADEMGYGDFYCINYPRQLTKLNPPGVVISRALSKLGEHGYNLLFNNCESFATFCKRGVARTLQVSENICKVVTTAARELQTMCKSPRFLVLLCNFVGAEGIEKVMQQTNVVGGVLYLVFEGMLCCVDIYKLYGHRHDGSITKKQFIELVVKRVVLSISKVIVGTTTGILGAGVGTIAGGVIGGVVTLGSTPGIVLGMCVGSFVGSVAGGVGGVATLNGFRTIIWSLSHSKDAESIEKLRLGDHVILPGEAWLHPRCHAIISGIDRADNKIKVIRNDKKRGVVEEWIAYVPMQRMVYNVGECYPVPKVLENARSQLGKKRYSIATYNCKTFAVEQKMKKELNF
ncbi:phage shock protein A (IM30) [Apostichopus japonicus]|uniref:Phage shock protein A (IM30) n=1 Tax=Stichopus japonicus TaxID=307972 RepID=A0A2G8LLY5_STIJA|nr:phage shock protein A (IM30) [Apostichopus japonicus]